MIALFREAAAAITFIAMFYTALVGLRTVTRCSLGMLLPVAVAVMIAWESLLLNLLSLTASVNAVSLLIGNLLIPAMGLVWIYRTNRFDQQKTGRVTVIRLLTRKLISLRVELMVVPLATILALTAIVYPPTNYDSMTYHLSRVAHWMQNGSIDYFPTSNDRQNVMGPGAEYLILLLQSISNSDRWANSVQLVAWILCLASIPSLSRIAGMPSRLSPYTVLFVAGLPMGVMQATSTQTDIVASLMVLAIISSTLPFLHKLPHWQFKDVALLSLVLAAALLVKPTSILVGSPVLIFGMWQIGYQLLHKRKPVKEVCYFLLVGTVIFTSIAGPDLLRKLSNTGSITAGRSEIYHLADDWKERAFNPIRTLGQHALMPGLATEIVREIGSITNLPPAYYIDQFWSNDVFDMHEDLVGNPLHIIVMGVVLSWTFLVFFRLPRRAILFAVIPYIAWILFHLIVRNQPWLSRLQTPLFVISPLAWGAFVYRQLPLARLRECLLIGTSVLCLAYGYVCATNNESKPLSIPALLSIDRDAAYYVNNNLLEPMHDSALKKLEETQCTRLGLYIGADSWGYPLIWRAMRMGAQVYEYTTPTDWPCLIFSDRGVPPTTDHNRPWVEVADNIYSKPNE